MVTPRNAPISTDDHPEDELATALPPTTLYITVKRGPRRSHHTFVLNRHIEGSPELNEALAAIGSNNEFACRFNTDSDGLTVVEVDIMSGKREGVYTAKLCRIALTLANATKTPKDDVTIAIEKAVTFTLAELMKALQLQPGRAYEMDVTVRELGGPSA